MCDIWLGFGSPSTLSNWGCDANNVPIQPVCSWAGITCDSNNCGMVTSINLEGAGFSGTISPSVGELSSLTYLNFGMNFLSGTIPDMFYDLKNLAQLYLDHNSLTRSVPPSIGSLSNLIVANFNGNSLQGTIPPVFSPLTGLSALDLGVNSFKGTIPTDLSKLTSLTYLNLGTNTLSGTIPDMFYNMRSLSQLFLDHNSLTGNVPPSICALISINRISMDNNQLSCYPTCLLNAPNPGNTLPVADPNALIPGGDGATYGDLTGSLTQLQVFAKRLDPAGDNTCKGTVVGPFFDWFTYKIVLSTVESSPRSPKIAGVETTYLFYVLMAIISGPSILAFFLEWRKLIEPWRAIHQKAYDSFKILYDGGRGFDWIDRDLEVKLSYLKYKGNPSYTYSGVPAYIYPEGVTLCGIRIFESGAFEDFLCYVMNEEDFLSIFLTDDEHPFQRYMKRSYFPAVHGTTLYLYSFAAIYKAEGYTSTYYSITFLVIIPGQLILSFILKRALTWNCCHTYCHANNLAWNYFVLIPVIILAVLQVFSIVFYVNSFTAAGLSYEVAFNYVFNYFLEVMIISTALSICRIFICFSAPFVDVVGVLQCFFPKPWASMRDKVVAMERAVTNERV